MSVLEYKICNIDIVPVPIPAGSTISVLWRLSGGLHPLWLDSHLLCMTKFRRIPAAATRKSGGFFNDKTGAAMLHSFINEALYPFDENPEITKQKIITLLQQQREKLGYSVAEISRLYSFTEQELASLEQDTQSWSDDLVFLLFNVYFSHDLIANKIAACYQQFLQEAAADD